MVTSATTEAANRAIDAGINAAKNVSNPACASLAGIQAALLEQAEALSELACCTSSIEDVRAELSGLIAGLKR